MAPHGRPPVLDELKRREICAILAIGSTRSVAAKYVGCSPSAIRDTAARDPAFFEQLRQAEARYEVRHLQCIHAAVSEGKNWRAAAWALERICPERFAARPPRCVTVEQVGQMLAQFSEILVERIPDNALRDDVLAHLQNMLASLEQDTGVHPAPPPSPAEDEPQEGAP